MSAALAFQICEACSLASCPGTCTVCPICENAGCSSVECATILRVIAEADQRRAEAGLPPLAESSDAEDDAFAITCMACCAEPTHSDGEWGYCARHAPVDAEAVVF